MTPFLKFNAMSALGAVMAIGLINFVIQPMVFPEFSPAGFDLFLVVMGIMNIFYIFGRYKWPY